MKTSDNVFVCFQVNLLTGIQQSRRMKAKLANLQILKAKLANSRITPLKVRWLFVLHYPTIFTQTEMKALVILSLSLSFSLSFNQYTVLLYLKFPFHPNSFKI